MRVLGLALVVAAGCADDDPSGRGGKRRQCGVSGGRVFDVWVGEVVALPYKPETSSPWDWDGDIPDWMLDVISTVADLTQEPHLVTASEILEAVDEVAPMLLEGTVPPDPQLFLYTTYEEATWTATTTLFGGTTTTTTWGTWMFEGWDVADDVYDPWFDVVTRVEVFDYEVLWLDVIDEDIALHDLVGWVGLDLDDLRREANCGPFQMAGAEGLYSIELEVTPR